MRGPIASEINTRINCKCRFNTGNLFDSNCFRNQRVDNRYETTISIHETVSIGVNFQCYIPEIKLPAAGGQSWHIDFKLVDPSHPISFTGSYLSALYQQRNNIPIDKALTTPAPLDITSTNSLGTTSYSYVAGTNTNFILTLSSINVGTTPNLIINFGKAGPIPTNDLCTYFTLACRVYTQNKFYVLVGQYGETFLNTLTMTQLLVLPTHITSDATVTLDVDIF